MTVINLLELLPRDLTTLGSGAPINLGDIGNFAKFGTPKTAEPVMGHVTFENIEEPTAKDLETLKEPYVRDSFELKDGKIRPIYRAIREVVKEPIGRADYGWDAVMRRKHLTAAYARGWKEFPYGFRAHNGVLHVVGGGPSLKDNLRALRRYSQMPKNYVLSVNKTHDFLWNLPKHKLGPPIKSWGAVLLDPCDWVKDYIKPRPGVQYLIGDQCAPTTFDVFEKEGLSKWVWRATNPTKDNDVVPQNMHFVFGGSTVGLRCRTMGYFMGFREIHYWGFDSSCEVTTDHPTGKLHSYEKIDSVKDRISIKAVDESPGGEMFDREFITNTHMARQAQEFIEIRDEWVRLFRAGKAEWIKDVFHGDGLLPTIAAGMGCHADPKRNRTEGMVPLIPGSPVGLYGNGGEIRHVAT